MGDNPTTAAMPLWREVRRDVAFLGAGSVFVILVQLAFRSVLIASLVPAQYGRLSLILSVYNSVWLVGASGLPNTIARLIAAIAPADDEGIIRAALRAGVIPTLLAALALAAVSTVILGSKLAALPAVAGLGSLIYTLIAMGILRGRGRMMAAALVMPIAALGELGPLLGMSLSGIGITLLSAYCAFCLGNVIGLAAAIIFVARSRPRGPAPRDGARAPRSRELLGSSIWLGMATAGVVALPLTLRVAATVDSYTVVALVDIAIVLLSVPQRIGTIIVFAVVPHATRRLRESGTNFRISLRENGLVVLPFAILAGIVASTPLVRLVFEGLGRPIYGESADYLAFALIAAPARILYGVVEGVLIAQGDGRFLGITSLLIATASAALIFAAAAVGSILVAFAVFTVALWAIYLTGLMRMSRSPVAAKAHLGRAQRARSTRDNSELPVPALDADAHAR